MVDMEGLFMLLLFPFLTAVCAKIINIIWEIIIRIFLINRELHGDKLVREMDKFILENAKDNDIAQSSSKKPMDTWHIRRIGWGFIIAIRISMSSYRETTELYSIYGTKKAFYKLMDRLEGEDNFIEIKIEKKEILIETYTFESLSPWKTSFTRDNIYLPSSEPFIGQKNVIDTIMNAYNKSIRTNKKRISAILLGFAGVGKSNLALYLAKEINGRVVYGYDLCAPISLDDMWRLSPTQDSPVILVLDEIDGAFEMAEKNERAKDFRSLAQNKTALNSLFDRFERTNYLIVIGTTNKTYKQLIDSGYQSYIRKGRFDICCTLSINDCKYHDNIYDS